MKAGSARRWHRGPGRREGHGHRLLGFEEEARGIGEEIEQIQRQGDKLNEIAILVRASYQMQ